MPTTNDAPFAAKTLSLASIMAALQTNEDLIRDLTSLGQATADQVKSLYKKLEQHRADAKALRDRVASKKLLIRVGADTDVRSRQQSILEQIEDASKRIQMHRDDPPLAAVYQTTRAGLYVALASTYLESAARSVTFTDAEVEELEVLIRRATLDTIARQRLADVLDAAIQISKLLLRVALKVVAL